MKRFLRKSTPAENVALYNERTFYKALTRDLGVAKDTVIIESPFITTRRVRALMPILQFLNSKGVRVIVNTRNPDEHNDEYRQQALDSIYELQQLDAEVFYTVRLHRKTVIIDSRVIWHGSLNILSHSDSSETMWRVESTDLANQLLGFTNLKKYTRS